MDELSPTQSAILSLLGQGKTPKEIRYALGISQGTYGTHLERARFKLGARTPTEAAVIFALNGRDK